MFEVDKPTLKKIELAILNYVVDFCEKHNITYFLVGGTLLGAVKYKGFIPWDDDIDIGMLRDDYERFLELFSAEDSNFYLHYNHKGNKDCCYAFTKICAKGTTIDDLYQNKEKIGIHIDLFPFDSFKDEERGKKLLSKFIFIRRFMAAKGRKIKFNSLADVFKSLAVICLFPISNYYFNLLIKRWVKEERQDDGLVALIIGRKREFTAYPKDFFTTFRKVEFEGREYNSIAGYDEDLKSIYGKNYLEPVSFGHQFAHHYFRAYINDDCQIEY